MFMPLLIAIAALLIYPSYILAAVLGLGAFAYIKFAGSHEDDDRIPHIAHQLAYRVLCVKLLAFNGEQDQASLEVHGTAVLDDMENAYMRRELRAAASVTPEYWKDAARTVARYSGGSSEFFLTRFESIIVQLTAQPCSRGQGQFHLRDEVQDRLIDLAKLWKIGPKTVRNILRDNQVVPSERLQKW